MKLAIGGDHAGFPLKGPVIEFLRGQGHEVADFGTHSPTPVDFPDIARLVCDAVVSGASERGIMVCGTGVGACIAANKIPGIRAALCHDTYSAHQCVEHDDVNVLCVGAWIVGIRAMGNRPNRTITLSQTALIDRIVNQFNQTTANPIGTPLLHSIKLSRADTVHCIWQPGICCAYVWEYLPDGECWATWTAVHSSGGQVGIWKLWLRLTSMRCKGLRV